MVPLREPSCSRVVVLLIALVAVLAAAAGGAAGGAAAQEAAEKAAPAQPAAPASAPCTRGEALEELGLFDKAEAAYLEDLKLKAGLACGKEGLEGLADEDDWWEWIATAVKDVLAIVAAALLAFALLGLLLVLALRLFGYRRDPTLQIKPLDDTGAEKKMGAQLAGLIGDRITASREGGVDLLNGRASLSESLKPLGEISTEAKAAVSVFSVAEKLIPRQDFDVTGALQRQGERGYGISVQVGEENGGLDVATFWGEDFGAPDDEVKAYQQLSVPAAAWINHKLATDLGSEEGLLSEDAGSWAVFKAGYECHGRGAEEAAADLYEAALELDPANVGALANLGLVRLREDNYKSGEELLTEALRQLTPVLEPLLTPYRYRIRYSLAALHANRAAEHRKDWAADRQRANEGAIELVKDICTVLVTNKGTEELRKLLAKEMLPAALVLYAGTMPEEADTGGAEEGEEWIGQPGQEQCILTLATRKELTRAQAIAYVKANSGKSPRVLYNLACTYTQLGSLDEAEGCLTRGLKHASSRTRRRLAGWALSDASLRPLLAVRPVLRDMVEDWAKPAAQ